MILLRILKDLRELCFVNYRIIHKCLENMPLLLFPFFVAYFFEAILKLYIKL